MITPFVFDLRGIFDEKYTIFMNYKHGKQMKEKSFLKKIMI
jgi:hypothetical protein